MQEVKDALESVRKDMPGMPEVTDSDFYEIEPETKKLKLRKMPRTILDRLKEKKVILDYYKQL